MAASDDVTSVCIVVAASDDVTGVCTTVVAIDISLIAMLKLVELIVYC